MSQQTSKLKIANARRILITGTSNSGKLTFVKALTGSLPPLTGPDASHAGLSHTLQLDTSYYDVDIPVWIDEVPAPGSSAEKVWTAGYLTSEAKEVLNALGGFVVTFRKPNDQAGLEAVKTLLSSHQSIVKACGYSWDGVCLAVAMPQSLQPSLELSDEDWEDVCREYQFEYIDFESKARNDYGEVTGMERVKEALEANDWTGDDGGDLDDLGSLGSLDKDDEDLWGGDGADPLKFIGDEMEREMFGLHSAIFPTEDSTSEAGDPEGDDVEKLDSIMLRLQAMKNLGDILPQEERRKLAARAIKDIMKSSS